LAIVTAAAQITAVALGLVVLRFLTERPEDAHWLTPKPRAWLEGRLRARSEANMLVADSRSCEL
jgi:ACS family tartrate transporter-like MFS transporter